MRMRLEVHFRFFSFYLPSRCLLTRLALVRSQKEENEKKEEARRREGERGVERVVREFERELEREKRDRKEKVSCVGFAVGRSAHRSPSRVAWLFESGEARRCDGCTDIS